MIGTGKVISTSLDKAKRLIVKILFRGKLVNGNGDVRTPVEASPFGIDSNPIEGKVALYLRSTVDGKYYVAGYLNTKRKAEPGELRLFSTDDDGAEQTYQWFKKDGTIEILGNDDWMVSFTELKKAFNDLKADHNTLRTFISTHVHPTTSPGSPTGVTAGTPAASTANIDPAKLLKVKTKKP